MPSLLGPPAPLVRQNCGPQDPFATSVVQPFGVWYSSVVSTYTVAGIVLTQQASGLQGDILSTDSLYSTC